MFSKKHEIAAVIDKKTVSETAGAVRLSGELPVCTGRLPPSRYYRHLERELLRRCETLPEPGELRLHTVLYAPSETLCSVFVEARFQFHGRSVPFFTDGCVWDLRSGFPLGFRELTGLRFSVHRLWPKLEPRREPDWLLRSFPGWEGNMKKALSRYRFYLEPGTLILYLPPDTPDVLPDCVCRLPFSGK